MLEELNQNRKTTDRSAFYTAMSDFYTESEGHQSPVKRLIQHKNTAFEYKKVMKDSIDKGEYALTYTTGP
jgi:hypothetical protein